MPICQLQGTSGAIAPADPGVGTGTGALWVQADPCTAQAGMDPCEPQAGIPAVLPGEAAAVPPAVSAAHRHKPPVRATRRNEAWAMDFVADRLHGGSKLRVFTVIDVYTRECLAAASAFRDGPRSWRLWSPYDVTGVHRNASTVSREVNLPVGSQTCGRISTRSP